jgi:hypothetical protein
MRYRGEDIGPGQLARVGERHNAINKFGAVVLSATRFWRRCAHKIVPGHNLGHQGVTNGARCRQRAANIKQRSARIADEAGRCFSVEEASATTTANDARGVAGKQLVEEHAAGADIKAAAAHLGRIRGRPVEISDVGDPTNVHKQAHGPLVRGPQHLAVKVAAFVAREYTVLAI